jgi:hypothetical protein
VSTRGRGKYGVRFTRFVRSGAPGGYSTVELVHLFPTARERDVYARKLRHERRRSRKTCQIFEIFEVDVAELAWFEPAYQRSVIIEDQPESQYGLVRIYASEPPTYDVRYARDEDELRRMLASQWEEAYPQPTPGEPHAPYDVHFFTADGPPRLHIVIEQDDEGEDSE